MILFVVKMVVRYRQNYRFLSHRNKAASRRRLRYKLRMTRPVSSVCFLTGLGCFDFLKLWRLVECFAGRFLFFLGVPLFVLEFPPPQFADHFKRVETPASNNFPFRFPCIKVPDSLSTTFKSRWLWGEAFFVQPKNPLPYPR